MGEETVADIMPQLEEEEHHYMSPAQSPGTEEEGDIISDIERIQRALTGESGVLRVSLKHL